MAGWLPTKTESQVSSMSPTTPNSESVHIPTVSTSSVFVPNTSIPCVPISAQSTLMPAQSAQMTIETMSSVPRWGRYPGEIP